MATFLKPITGMGRESRLTQLKINKMSLIPKSCATGKPRSCFKDGVM